ncbi:hypothetical protein [Mucilaginibacter dorajii]|uniref:Uncharacterized protein n=1 Tax=Mucilaginibacter dorajii TaxID=692994 RepID=A0ABP7PPT8_9SPHI|nr:hypothetical protein [Mucilaginibacter dorajii]MCS3736936.1 Na+-transporting NADH:ubiquinone oxidoreductase subunit NqrF [Mucilaginibacter dorajii]
MTSQKYLNGVLTVIAFCLVILTLSVVGVFPKANAAVTPSKFVTVPLNPDGSLNVKVLGEQEINIVRVAGINIAADDAKGGKLPVSVK